MADQQLKRRWLPRFSVRTFLFLVTLACGYAACWWPTKTMGVDHAARHDVESGYVWRTQAIAVAPLVIAVNEVSMEDSPPAIIVDYHATRYYFWFFGYIAKLPYERQFRLSNTGGDSGAPAGQKTSES